MSSGWLYVACPALAVLVVRVIMQILKDRHDPKATGNPLERGKQRLK